ncbi:MAG: mechanosensitive ion channel [Blautia sp.]|nr:mechanosensitive ion channel [Blautia sp.]
MELIANENYEDLKGSAKGFLQIVTSDDMYYALFLLVVMIAAVKLLDLIFLPFKNRQRTGILTTLVKWCLQAFIVIILGMKIISLSNTLSGFASQILMSSSLIVVVLGFVFQEGLTNIVHGIILTVFKPFNIGDRVHTSIDGESITGYVQSINLRNTVIQNALNMSCVIVPNSKMDLCVLENNYFGTDRISSNFLDLSITYESDLEKAILIIQQTVEAHPLVQKLRKSKGITDPVVVMVRELGADGICLRGIVQTLTIEENFGACSDIRRELVLRFQNDPDVCFAYPHRHLVQ